MRNGQTPSYFKHLVNNYMDDTTFQELIKDKKNVCICFSFNSHNTSLETTHPLVKKVLTKAFNDSYFERKAKNKKSPKNIPNPTKQLISNLVISSLIFCF